jgi:hypothetical protein
VVYRQAAVWLTDEESAALVKETTAAFAAQAARTPDGERTRRYFSLIAMPDGSSPGTLWSRLHQHVQPLEQYGLHHREVTGDDHAWAASAAKPALASLPVVG